MSRKSGFLSRRRREAIYRRDAFRCLWCDREIDHTELSLDHMIPTSLGGNHCTANLFTSCKRHNSARGNMSVWSFALRTCEPLLGVTVESVLVRILRAVATPVPQYRKKAA